MAIPTEPGFGWIALNGDGSSVAVRGAISLDKRLERHRIDVGAPTP